jgi:hypothetical protein
MDMLDFTTPSWDFEPITRPVYDHAGRKIDGYIEVVNGTTDQHLGLHTESYRPVPNRQLVEQFEKAVRESNVSDDFQIKVTDIDNGKRLQVEAFFPGVTIQPRVGDITAYQAFGRNSFDGSWSLSNEMMGKRLVCTNGMVIASPLARYIQKHTANVNVDGIAGRMSGCLNVFLGLEDEYRELIETPVSTPQAERIFKALCPAPVAKDGSNWNQTQVEQLRQNYRADSRNLGANAYALLNAITYWSTHTQGYKRPEATRVTREAAVARLLSSNKWKELTA